jgi:hypothetical protein
MAQSPSKPRMVREPVQVYLAPDDSELLSRLTTETGLSKAEILRRGIRSFAAESGARSPMLDFLAESAKGPWPENVALRHDEVVTDFHRPKRKKK